MRKSKKKNTLRGIKNALGGIMENSLIGNPKLLEIIEPPEVFQSPTLDWITTSRSGFEYIWMRPMVENIMKILMKCKTFDYWYCSAITVVISPHTLLNLMGWEYNPETEEDAQPEELRGVIVLSEHLLEMYEIQRQKSLECFDESITNPVYRVIAHELIHFAAPLAMICQYQLTSQGYPDYMINQHVLDFGELCAEFEQKMRFPKDFVLESYISLYDLIELPGGHEFTENLYAKILPEIAEKRRNVFSEFHYEKGKITEKPTMMSTIEGILSLL